MTSTPIMPWQKSEPVKGEMYHQTDQEYFCNYDDFISSHRLDDFRRGPDVFKAKADGRLVDPDRPAYAFGRAAHCFILEGNDAFNARYCVDDGPLNPTTGRPYGRDTNKFQGWLREVVATGKEPITFAEFDAISTMYTSISDHKEAADLLGNADHVEMSIYAELPSFTLRGRLDALDLNRNKVVDLKTTDDLDRFEKAAWQYGYHMQLAFYRKLTWFLTGKVFDVSLVAVEKSGLYRVGVWHLLPATLDEAEREIDESLADLAACIKSDSWPSRYEFPRTM